MNNSLFKRLTTILDRMAVWFFLAVLLYTLVSLTSYGFAGESLPAFVRIPRMSPGFADLIQLSHSSGCGAAFADLLSNRINCDPWSRPFNYTYFSLALFRVFGINNASTPLVGALIGLLALIVSILFIFACVRKRSYAYWLSALFLSSFPFQLALERGNYDLVVLAGSLLIPILMASRIGFLAPTLAFGVTALKLFPLAGLAPWSIGLITSSEARWPDEKRIRWIGASILLATILGVTVQIGDLQLIMNNTPKPDGVTSFGLFASYQSFLGFPMGIALSILKLAMIASSAHWYAKKYHTKIAPTKNQPRLAQQTAVLFGFIISIVYLISRSFDYRLIFCLGILPALVNARQGQCEQTQKQIALAWGGLILIGYEQYLGGTLGKFLHLLSDFAVQPLLVGLLIGFLIGSRTKL